LQPEDDRTTGRRLEFPDTAVGSVRIAGMSGVVEVAAQGTIEVPDGAVAMLQLDGDGGPLDDCGFLRSLPPDAFETLAAHPSWFDDEALASITHLTGLQSLIVGKGVSDDGLAALGGLQSLTTLVVKSDRVTDAGLARLVLPPSVSTLSIEAPSISDEGVRHLARNAGGVRHLTLHSPNLTDVGLEELRVIDSLEALEVSSPLVRGSFLRAFAGTGLHTVGLSKCEIGSECLAHLATLPALDTLHLGRTPIGDEHVEAMASLPPSLRTLSADRTRLTEDGRMELHRRLPHVAVDGVRYTPEGLARLAG
jgi:hypothetical protein